jgi:hypothetical protein
MSSIPLLIPGYAQSGTWWQPKPFTGLTWQWQIGSVPAVSSLLNVDMYDVDLFETPASTIKAMKDRGIVVTCYFSAGTYEGWRPDWKTFFPFITGDSYTGNEPPFLGNMADWDERWLDIRRIDLLEPIMRGRMKMAREKGCDCVEPDNMDSYSNLGEVKPAGSYTAAHQIAYNRKIAEWAHAETLSVALKNDLGQLDSLVDHFDWALNEQCYQYNECDEYTVFINAGKAVFGVEYQGNTATFCPKAFASGYSWLKKNLSLDDWVEACDVKDTSSAIAIRQDRGYGPAQGLTADRPRTTFDIHGRIVDKPGVIPGVYITWYGSSALKRYCIVGENRR